MAMKIRICAEYATRINEALDAVNGKATAFTVTNFKEVASYAERAEKQLEKSKLAKSERVGAFAICTPDGPSAKSYKYSAKSTTIRIERGSKDWYLVGVSDTQVSPRQNEKMIIKITQTQAEIIQAKSIADFVVIIPSKGLMAA